MCKKILPITLDNATANDNIQRILKHRLQMFSGKRLLCDRKFLYVRCCAHILNLIVQEGLSLAYDLLENIRDSVICESIWFKEITYTTCVESIGIKSGDGLSLDVSTR